MSSRWGPIEGLWYLRILNLSRILDQAALSVWPETAGLAETATSFARGTTTQTMRDDLASPFPLVGHLAKPVVDLYLWSRKLRSVRARIRKLTIGLVPTLDAAGNLTVGDGGMRTELELHERRIENSTNFVGGIGVVGGIAPYNGAIGASLMLGVFRSPDLSVRPVPVMDGERFSQVSIPGYYELMFLNIDELLGVDRECARKGIPLLNEIAIGCVSVLKLVAPLATLLDGAAQVRQTGMLLVPAGLLIEKIGMWWSEALSGLPTDRVPKSPEALFDLMTAVEAAWHPGASGGLFRSQGGYTAIDLNSITGRIQTELRKELIPDEGGIRAKRFELQTQEMINTTRWKPCAELLALRGRELKLLGNKNPFTEIDAIGCWNDSLLIVSCKSMPVPSFTGIPLQRRRRSVRTNVETAIRELDEVLEQLRRQPQGSNYDFRQFRTLVGVVCLPEHVWLGDKTHDRSENGLFRCCSHWELMRWLQGEDPCPVQTSFGRSPARG